MVDLDYFSFSQSQFGSTVTARLRIAAKHLPIISMPLHPTHGTHLNEGLNMYNLFGHAHMEY